MVARHRTLSALCVIFLVTGLLINTVTPAFSSSWMTGKYLDFPSGTQTYPDVVSSPDGVFYMAYRLSSPERIIIARWNGYSWTTLHTITTSTPGVNVTTFSDYLWLVVRSDTDIHLAFQGYYSTNPSSNVNADRIVQYAHYDRTYWAFDTVEVLPANGGMTSVSYFNMTVDAYNHPHMIIAISDATAPGYSALDYAVKTGIWEITTPFESFTGADDYQYPSVATDSTGHAYIAFEDTTGPQHKMVLASNASGSWISSDLFFEKPGLGISPYDLRSDISGNLYLTYTEVGAKSTSYYGSNMGGTWTFSPVPGSTGDDTAPRLSINNSGVKLLTYLTNESSGNKRLKVAFQRPGGTWQTESPDSSPDMDVILACAINNNNQAMVINHRSTSDWYATATLGVSEIISVGVPYNSIYGVGQPLTFTITYSEPVTVITTGGTPYLPVTLNTGAVQAAYFSGSGSSALTFRYTVSSGDQDSDGIILGSDLALNGGAIKNSSGADVNLTLWNVSSTAGVFVDGFPPAAPVVISPANGSVMKSSNLVMNGTAEANNTVMVYLDGTYKGTSTVDASGHWYWTPTTTLSEGAHTTSAKARDDAGNVSASSNTNTFTVDNTPPAAPVLLNPANASVTNGTPTFNGTAEAASTVTVSVDGAPVGMTTTNGSGSWSFTQPTALAGGAHTARVTATDAAGNTSASSNTNTFTVDITPPDVPVLQTPANGSSINDNTPTYTGTAENNSTVTVYVDGNSIGVTTANGSGSWSFTPVTALADGPHTVKTAATDAVGNTKGFSITHSFSIDTLPPSTPVIVSPADGSRTNDSTPAISGTAEANSSITIVVDGATLGSASANGSGTWSWTVSAALPDGPHTLLARATDAAGNTGADSSLSTFIVDTLAPTATLTTSAASLTNNPIIPVTLTFSEPVSDLRLSSFVVENGTVSSLAGSETGYTFNLTAAGQGLVKVSLLALAAHDAAGNGSQASNQLAVTYDSLSPSIVSINRADASPTNAGLVHFTITFSEAVTGLDKSAFTLATTGLSGSSIQSFYGSGSVYTLAVATGTGSGGLRVNLAPGSIVVDVAGNGLATSGAGWQSGIYTAGETYTVDRTLPLAQLINPALLPRSGSGSYSFNVRFSDDLGLDPSLFVDGNIRLVGTTFDRLARWVSTSEVTPGKVYEVTYQVDAPAEGWQSVPYATYDLILLAGQVHDLNGSFIEQQTLGSIEKERYYIWFMFIENK